MEVDKKEYFKNYYREYRKKNREKYNAYYRNYNAKKKDLIQLKINEELYKQIKEQVLKDLNLN